MPQVEFKHAFEQPYRTDSCGSLSHPFAAGGGRLLMAEWSRPVLANERPVSTGLPTFRIALAQGHTAVTLNRSQSASTCRALSLSARSFKSPLRWKMA